MTNSMHEAQEKLMVLLKDVTIAGGKDNVMFTRGSKSFEIANRLFYRETGMVSLSIDRGGQFIEIVPVTDMMWLTVYMKHSIELGLRQ